MERGNSVHSLSSRGGSDMGSRYLMESGLYITSFAATIFVAALVTVGILFITLLIALTVMLQSCQSSSAGVVQLREASDDHGYCKDFALHVELNKLEADEFPTICKTHAIRYIKEGQYLRDLRLTMSVVERYFHGLTSQNDGLDVILVDIDDIIPSNPHLTHPLQYRFDQHDEDDWAEEAKHLRHMLVLGLHMKLRARGWSLVFISRKPEKQRNAIRESLIISGYMGWSSLIMRLDDEMHMESWEYFSRKREELQNQGFRITSVISSQIDALTGPCLGKRNFKLANPIFYKSEHRNESIQLLQ